MMIIGDAYRMPLIVINSPSILRLKPQFSRPKVEDHDRLAIS